MSDITLSAGVRQNLLSLQNTAELMSETQNRLATGKKVNSALDNPTNFFTAQSLQSRAGDMAALLDNMSTGIKTLEAADNGLTAITKTIESMQSTLRQARQDRSFKSEDYVMNVGATPAGTEELSFTGGAFGTATQTVALTTVDVAATSAQVVGGTFTAMDFNDSAATPAVATGTADFTDIDLSNNADNEFEFDLGGETITLVQADGGVDDIIDIDEAVTAITAAIAGNVNLAGDYTVARGTGANADRLVFTSVATGIAAEVEIDNIAVGGTGVLANTTDLGFADPTTVNGTEAAPRTLSFDIEVDDNGTVETITIDDTAVALAGDFDNVIDSLAELATIVSAQLPAGVTAAAGTGANAGRLVFTAASDGATSEIDITNLVATNISNTSGVAAANDTGDDETYRARTVDELVTAINSDDDLREMIRASNDTGRLRIENLSTQELEMTGFNTAGDITGGVGEQAIAGNAVRANLVKQFNELRDQLDKLADDASYNGVNLLRGDLLKLTFNETGTSTIEIQAKDLEGDERPINTSTLNITQAEEPDFDSDETIDLRLNALKDALGVIRSQSSSFGSNLSIVENRTQFTKSMINTLQTGADNLVLADTNEEAANMLALQTRQQLSSTALSLASQADQAVLRLF